MPAQQQHHVTTAYLSAGAINVGQVAVKDAAGVGYVVATAGNRTAASRGPSGIAVSSSAGFPGDPSFELQAVGEVPPEITGLGTGAAEYVNVSDAGMLQRTATLDATVVGHCDADGTAYVCFPLAGWNFAGVAAALPDGSIQYRVPGGGGALGGAAHASISSDGALELANDRTGGAALTGDLRLANDWLIAARLAGADVCVMLGGDGNIYAFWDGLHANEAHLSLDARLQEAFALSVDTTGTPVAGLGGYGPGGLNELTLRMMAMHPNLALIPVASLRALGDDIFTGGLGYLWIEDVATVRGGALRTSGYGLWSRASDHHPMVTIGNTDYDLLAPPTGPAKEQTVDITSGNQTVDLSAGRILKIIGTAGDTLTVTVTPQPTSDALADVFEVRNTSNVSIIFTNALSGKTTVDVSSNASGNLRTTPDGISGVWFNADGTTGGVTV